MSIRGKITKINYYEQKIHNVINIVLAILFSSIVLLMIVFGVFEKYDIVPPTYLELTAKGIIAIAIILFFIKLLLILFYSIFLRIIPDSTDYVKDINEPENLENDPDDIINEAYLQLENLDEEFDKKGFIDPGKLEAALKNLEEAEKNRNRKLYYIAGREYSFENDLETQKALLTNIVSKQSLTNLILMGLEEIGDLRSIKIDYKGIIEFHEEASAEDKAIRINEIKFLIPDKNGPFSFGGNKPEKFQLPKFNQSKEDFLYLGKISNEDPYFNWIETKEIHLVFPVFTCVFSGIFMDYSSPMTPQILNPEVMSNVWGNRHLDIANHSLQERNYSLVDKVDNTSINSDEFDSIQVCGVPFWIQGNETPVCPKSGKIMRFLCSIKSDGSWKFMNKATGENTNEYLCYGDYGSIYVFYEPSSKIVCYIGQMY